MALMERSRGTSHRSLSASSREGKLDAVQGVQIGVAAGQGQAQHGVVLQQLLDPRHLHDLTPGALELFLDPGEHALPGPFVGAQLGVLLGDAHIRLEQAHLGVAEQRLEEGPFLVHALQPGQAFRFSAAPALQGGADAVPSRQGLARLAPAEDPGDGPHG
jgi:hypothetical protein